MALIYKGKFIKKSSYKYAECSGCENKVNENQAYEEVILRHLDRSEHILLCSSCYEQAKSYGVL